MLVNVVVKRTTLPGVVEATVPGRPMAREATGTVRAQLGLVLPGAQAVPVAVEVAVAVSR